VEPVAAETIPEPRQNAGTEDLSSRGRTLPYDDGNFIGQHLIRKISPAELMTVRRVLNEHAAQNGLDTEEPSTV
jgi:hypothetical protein